MYRFSVMFFMQHFFYMFQVRDVRLITCNKTRRFKGIAYVEFKDPESVPLVSLCSDYDWPLCIQVDPDLAH
jgi:hypothetical protein